MQEGLRSCHAGHRERGLVAASQASTLQSDNATLTGEISALQTKLSKVTYDPSGLNGLPTLKISGANLQIISGSGATDAAVNGLGSWCRSAFCGAPMRDEAPPVAGCR
jgi:hypothetical protein